MAKDKTLQYQEDSSRLVDLLGRNNIISATHCITRVRLVLKDTKNLDIKEIEKIPSVQGTFNAGGQFQVIIGTDVPKFFEYFITEAGINASSKSEVKAVAEEQAKATGNKFQRALGWFGSIFVPIIPVIVAGGLILAFRNLLETDWNGEAAGGKATDIWFFLGLNNFLWVIGEAIFVFLPTYVVYTIFVKQGAPAILGICVGIMLTAPSTVNLYSLFGNMGKYYLPYDLVVGAGSTAVILDAGVYGWADIANQVNALGGSLNPDSLDHKANQDALNAWLVAGGYTTNGEAYYIDTMTEAINSSGATWGGWPFWPWAIQYNAQVVPAMFVGLFAAWLYKFINRHTWSSLQYVWPPFATLVITAFMAFGVLGPIGAIIQYYISLGFYYGFSDPIAMWFVAPLFGLLYAPMVVTGLHYVMNPVMIQLSEMQVIIDGAAVTANVNYIFPILALSNMAQGAAVFAVVWMARKDAKMKEMGVAAGVTCWLGVTEPAMYGVNLKYFFPFVAAMIASMVGAFLVVGFDITGVMIGMGGILAPLSIQTTAIAPGASAVTGAMWGAWSILIYVFIMIAVVITAFVLTITLSRMTKFTDKFATSNWHDYLADINVTASKDASLWIDEDSSSKSKVGVTAKSGKSGSKATATKKSSTTRRVASPRAR